MDKLGFLLLFFIIYMPLSKANILAELERHLLKHSNPIAQKNKERLSAKINQSQTFRDSYLPSISAGLFSEKSDIKSRFGNTFIEFENPIENGINANLNYSLINDFQGYHLYQSAKFRAEGQNKNWLYEKNQNILTLGRLYLELCKIDYQLELLNQLLSIDQKTQKTTQARFNKGLSPRSELNRAKFRSLDIKDEIASLNLKKLESINELQKLFNIPFDFSKFEPIAKDKIQKIQNSWLKETPKINTALVEIETKNDQLQQQKLNLEEKKNDRLSQLMRLSPRLSFDLNHRYFKQREVDFWNDDRLEETRAVLSLNIPLFEGLNRYTDIQQARIQEEIGLYQLRQTHIGLRESIKTTIGQTNFFIQKIQRDNEQLKLSESILNASLKKYQLGSASLRDLVEDQRFHQRQLIQLIDSQFEFLKKYIEYQSYIISGNNYSVAKLLLGEKG